MPSQSFKYAHYFPRTSIFLVFKSSKIGSLHKRQLSGRKQIFIKGYMTLSAKVHRSETPFCDKSSVLAILQRTGF